MNDQTMSEGPADGVDEDAAPLVGRSDADADAARAGSTKGQGDRFGDAVRQFIGGDQSNRDGEGVPVGDADANADARAAGGEGDGPDAGASTPNVHLPLGQPPS
jgi:hypothetical protein